MRRSELRSNFPHTERTAYLNHAATGPLSRPVMQIVNQYLEQRHRTHIENYHDFQPVVDSARHRVAEMLGTQADRVEFAPNTSYALNVLAQGLDWQPGDRVAVPGCEFPANVYPFLNIRSRGVSVDFIPHDEGTISLESIERTLRPDTRVLTVSWVQFLSGFRLDLKAVGALCRDRNVIFCVDAIQGLGAMQLDVEACDVDFLACGGHKWIMSMQGIGFLYLTEKLQERISPMAGWLHGPVDWDNFFRYDLVFHPDASRFRLGTMNNAGIASLDAALELYQQAGPAWCEKQVLERTAQLSEGLRTLGLDRFGSGDPNHASGIVTLRHERAEALYRHLLENQIEGALRHNMLRLSPTYYNSAEEIERTLDVMESFTGRR